MFALNDLINAGEYFLFITGELLALFIGVSFLVAMLREFISEESLRKFLTRPSKWTGNVLGAFFGALTPFCSCSTIPILVGLMSAGAPFGATMSFLVASPLLNPVILALFLLLLGWKVTILYASVTFVAAVLSGAVWEQMGLASDYKMASQQSARCCCGCGPVEPEIMPVNWQDKTKRAGVQTWALFRQVLPYLLFGAGIGAFIYGFVPEEFIIRVAGPDSLLAIPVAAVVGVPMYIRVETMLPISSVLLEKGMSIGALIALIIGGAGASIPEVTLLASIFKARLVAIFVVTILFVAIVAGYIFQVLQTAII